MSRREFPAGWEAAEIADVSDVGGGLTKNSGRSGLSLRRPYLRVANVYADELRLSEVAEIGVTEADAQRTALEVGDVLVVEGNGSIDQVGRVAMWDGSIEGCLHQNHLIRVRSAAAIRPKFLLRWMLSPEGRRAIERMASSSAGLHTLSISKVASLPIPVPPLPEQHRIVETIEALTTRSRRAREALDTLPTLINRYRQSVFAAAFRGDLTAEWRELHPGHDAAELLNRIRKERGAFVNRDVADDNLPGGWRWEYICNLADVGTGATPKKNEPKYYEGGTIPWVNSGSINGPYIAEASKLITETAILETNAKIFRKNTLLIAMYGEGQTRGRVSELLLDAATNQACAAISFSGSAEQLREYVKLYLTGRYLELRNEASGGVQSNLNLMIVKNILVPIPPPAECIAITKKVGALLVHIDQILQNVRRADRRLSTLDQSILAKAFRGELVPQDPNDEPASILLERIRAERAAAGPAPRRGRRPKATGDN